MGGAPVISITIVGRPVPQGSLRSFKHPSTGRIVTTHARASTVAFRQEVASVAARSHDGRPLVDAAVAVDLLCLFARPRSHFGRGSRSHVLRPSAPVHMAVRPDGDKLARLVLDALVGTVIRDDAQVSLLTVAKRYSEPERCEVAVWKLYDERGDRLGEDQGDDRIQLTLNDGEAEA